MRATARGNIEAKPNRIEHGNGNDRQVNQDSRREAGGSYGSRDPSDHHHVLACADEAHAQFIVTGDRHLLALGRYRNAKIVSASAFLQIQKACKSEKLSITEQA